MWDLDPNLIGSQSYSDTKDPMTLRKIQNSFLFLVLQMEPKCPKLIKICNKQLSPVVMAQIDYLNIYYEL